MTEVLGERASVLADFTRVHLGSAEIAVRRATSARSAASRQLAWERAALQFEKAADAAGKAAAVARARASEPKVEG